MCPDLTSPKKLELGSTAIFADFPSACQCSLRQAGGMGAADTPAASSAVVESKQARLRPADTQNPLIWQTLGRFCTFVHSLIETYRDI